MGLNETFIKIVKNLIKNGEENKYIDITLAPDKERKLERLDQELFSRYLMIKERNLKERERFKQEIKEITEQVQTRLQKYSVKVYVDFDERSNPSYYDIKINLQKRLTEEEFKSFVAEAKEIGLVYNPQTKIWGYVGKFGEKPSFRL
jgi:hypothetical protein